MKAIIAIAAVGIASGCATYVGERSATPHRYAPGALSLNLTQRGDATLMLELRNMTSRPITNAFPESLFEGEFMLVQVGQVPCTMYHKAYFDLLIHALWMNPQRTIEAGGEITYEVALQDLVNPLAEWQPVDATPIIIFAIMGGFDIQSNAIIMKHRERMNWRTTH